MSIKEINNVFNKGLDMMRNGNYKEAEALFEKAKNMTLDSNRK